MNHLRSALNKVKRNSGKEWVGYLTPSEILALVKDGAKPVNSNRDKIDMAEQDKRSGNGQGSWFYFYLGKTKPDKDLDIFSKANKRGEI